MSLILQIDSQGQPNKWINWRTATTYKSKNLVAWELGNFETIIRGGINAVSGQRSIIVASSIIAIKGNTSKRKKRPPGLNNRELFRRDRHMCAYCGKVYGYSNLSRDHILPTSRGGEDSWANTVTSCRSCNNLKAGKTPEEAGMMLLYVPYVPSRAEYLILQNRNLLADQMTLLLSFVSENSPVRQHIKVEHE